MKLNNHEIPSPFAAQVSTQNQHIIRISDFIVSANPEDTLITYSLGSCIGLTLYDPHKRIGGMLHSLMPSSNLDPQEARKNPAMFTDTGVIALLAGILRYGASKDRLIAKIAGGASLFEESGAFRVGEKNFTIVRKVLWKNDILVAAKDVGGASPRTLRLDIADGTTTVEKGGSIMTLG